MATPKPHTYRIPKTHSVASKMKKGDEMTARMKMMDDDGDEETYPMEEVESSPYQAPVAGAKPKQKARTAAEALRRKRERPIT